MALVSRSDPDFAEKREARKERYTALFRERKIGPATFLVSMAIAGYSGRQANEELRLLEAERSYIQQERTERWKRITGRMQMKSSL